MINGQKKWPFWLSIGVLFFVFLYLIRGILLPFVLGIFIAYFLHPLVNRLQKNGTPRSMATLMVLASFFLTLLLLSMLIVPIVAGQLSDLIFSLPDYISSYQQKYAPDLSRWLGDLPDGTIKGIKSAAVNFSGDAVKVVGEFVSSVLHSGMAIAHVLLLILITPVVAVYLLRDWDDIMSRIDRLLPREHAATIHQQLAIINRTLAGFLRGQLNVCFIMATYYAVGLSLAGLKFGIIIGLMTGLLVIFPYIGLMLGVATGLGVAFFQFDDIMRIFLVLAVFLIGSVTEGYILTPRLVGGKVSLHPVWIIFGMLSGGALFGLVGVLLAVPITAVIGVLIRFAIERYLQSAYYRGGR